MVNPIAGAKISTAYRKKSPKGRPWSLGWHTGADIAAPINTPIVSATPGRVIAANAYDKTYGYKVIMRWRDYDVWYCHMPKGAANVVAGQNVEAGQRIGRVGVTGNTSGPHLHMELRHAGGRFAPASFLNPSTAINYRKYRPVTSKHTHIAKPHESLTIRESDGWVDVEGIVGKKPRKRFYSSKSVTGWLMVRAYINGAWTGDLGKLECRVVREPFKDKPSDPTGYDGRTLLTKDADNRFSFMYFGPIEPGRTYKVQIRVKGSGSFTSKGTNYIDYLQVAL